MEISTLSNWLIQYSHPHIEWSGDFLRWLKCKWFLCSLNPKPKGFPRQPTKQLLESNWFWWSGQWHVNAHPHIEKQSSLIIRKNVGRKIQEYFQGENWGSQMSIFKYYVGPKNLKNQWSTGNLNPSECQSTYFKALKSWLHQVLVDLQ